MFYLLVTVIVIALLWIFIKKKNITKYLVELVYERQLEKGIPAAVLISMIIMTFVVVAILLLQLFLVGGKINEITLAILALLFLTLFFLKIKFEKLP